MTKDYYYPKTIEPKPFIGPVLPDQSKNSAKEIYYPGQITQVPIAKPVIASNVVGSNLNTQSRKILGSFSFSRTGAIQVGTYKAGSSGDIRISPNGIVGRNSSGATTFSIDGTTGDATFKGTIAAGSVISATISATNITGQIVNAQIASIDYAKITSVAVTNADIVSLNATKITAGTLDAARIGAATITADKLSVSTLEAISANLGTVTAGTITGVTITGGVFQTASSGANRIVIDSLGGNPDLIEFYGSASSSNAAWTMGTSGTNDFYLVGSASGDDILFTSLSAIVFDAGDTIDLKGGNTRVNKIGSYNTGNTEFQDELKIKKDYIRLYDHGSTSFLNVSFEENGASSKIYIGSGTKTAIMPTSQGYRSLFCIESPEVWFMDIVGKDKQPDPLFDEVTTGKAHFIRIEDENGAHVGFQKWARRKGYENQRFTAASEAVYEANKAFWQQAHLDNRQ